jgi:hypothetical protein
MTYHDLDGREGFLTCDRPLCEARSNVFVARLGEPESYPEGWVETTVRFSGAPRVGHLCPAHAETA